jgi:hypothetical protein
MKSFGLLQQEGDMICLKDNSGFSVESGLKRGKKPIAVKAIATVGLI